MRLYEGQDLQLGFKSRFSIFFASWFELIFANEVIEAPAQVMPLRSEDLFYDRNVMSQIYQHAPIPQRWLKRNMEKFNTKLRKINKCYVLIFFSFQQLLHGYVVHRPHTYIDDITSADTHIARKVKIIWEPFPEVWPWSWWNHASWIFNPWEIFFCVRKRRLNPFCTTEELCISLCRLNTLCTTDELHISLCRLN